MKLAQFLCIPMVAYAISNGANEPIADNELGLTTKDCALQYCESLDALGLWLTIVSECNTHAPQLITHGNKHTTDPVARHDARSCALYLCPALADHATEYLQTGCIDTFKNFLKTQKAAN
jgi:hypothetical protein